MKNGGNLHLRIKDSGMGFDYQEVLSRIKEIDNNNKHGNALVQCLSDNLQYHHKGSEAEIEYSW